MIHISKQLSLPKEAVTQKMGFIGTTGSGKSYGAMKLAEGMLQASAQIIVIDPVGVWWGLRLNADGKTPSQFKIPIFGGLHADVPLESTAGVLLANLAVDRGISMIIDVSQFESDAQKARFCCDFADRFFFRKKASPSAVHLFIEECQEFVPQNPQREEARMLHAFTRMQKLGRNFGIGSTYITQRPQEVNKKALNMIQTLFVMRSSGTQERKAIEAWVKDKDLDADFVNELPKLKTGTCHLWSPEFVKSSTDTVIQIDARSTFDASATPEVGRSAKARHLAEIDLEKIRESIADTMEKAKANDPVELKKRIAELEKKRPAEVKVEVKEVPVMKDGQIARMEQCLKMVEQIFSDMKVEMARVKGVNLNQQKATTPVRGKHYLQLAPIGESPVKLKRSVDDYFNDKKPGGGILRMLKAAAMFGEISRARMALLARMSPTSGSFNTYLSEMRKRGWIDGNGSEFVITSAGKTAAGPVNALPTDPAALVDLWCDNLGNGGGAARMLRVLADQYPHGLGRERLGEMTEMSSTSGSFNTYLSTLNKQGLIEKKGAEIFASKELFQ